MAIDIYVDPAAGGANDGTSWADAFTNLQSALDTVAAGQEIGCRGTQTLTVTIDIDTTSGAKNNMIIIRGYNASGVDDGTRFVIDGNSAATNCLKTTGVMDGYHLENIECINATSHGIATDNTIKDDWIFNNVEWASNGGGGMVDTNRFRESSYYKCSWNNNSGSGTTTMSNYHTYDKCTSINNGGQGLSATKISNSIIHNNTGFGINSQDSKMHIINNIIDGNTSHGISSTLDGGIVANNRITNNGGYGINNTGWCFQANNGFYSNTSGETNGNVYGGEDSLSLSSDGYTDRSSDDFTLATDGEGVGVDIEVGEVGSGHSGFFTQGIPPEYAAGSGGARRSRGQYFGRG